VTTPACICEHPGLTYDGPDPECPTHGEREPACGCATLRPGESCPAHPFDPTAYKPVMTPATMGGVPNTPGTPRRTIRVPDALWNAAQAKAEEKGTDVSAVIRKALERFVKRG